MPVMHHVGLF